MFSIKNLKQYNMPKIYADVPWMAPNTFFTH